MSACRRGRAWSLGRVAVATVLLFAMSGCGDDGESGSTPKPTNPPVSTSTPRPTDTPQTNNTEQPTATNAVQTATPTPTETPISIAGDYSSTVLLDGGDVAHVNLTVESDGQTNGTFEIVGSAAATLRTRRALVTQTTQVSAGFVNLAGLVDPGTGAFHFSGNIGAIPFDLSGTIPASPDGTGSLTLIFDGQTYTSTISRGTGPTPLPTQGENPTPTVGPSDNARIVYAGGVLEPGIFVINLDGSGKTQIHQPPLGLDASPAWSPDGTMVAFATPDDENHHGTIGIVNADGSGFHRIGEDSAIIDGNPAWSPDASLIAFTSGGGDHIEVMNADGSGRHRIVSNTTTGEAYGHLSWSPDGTRIAFESTRPRQAGSESRFEIWVMNADGSNLVQLTNNDFPDRHPDWSPDGSRILFSRANTLQGGVMAIRPDGSGETRLVNDPFGTASPSWSNDGQSIAYTGVTGITIVNANGGNPMAVPGAPSLSDFDFK
jgi:Tol biopolymer transport system component